MGMGDEPPVSRDRKQKWVCGTTPTLPMQTGQTLQLKDSGYTN